MKPLLLSLWLSTFVAVFSLFAQNGAIVQETPGTPAAPTTSAPPEPVQSSNAPPSVPLEQVITAPPPLAPRPEAPAPAPAVPAGPRLVNLAPPAKRFGNGKIYIGHRYYEEKGGGWGWIKQEGDSWGSAKWIALKEDPIKGILMPSRKMGSRSADQNYEYRMTGYFSDKVAYDPHLDERLPIFVIESYTSLGPAKPLERRPGPPDRFTRAKRSRSSSREDRPVPSPDGDSF